jgi:heme A synthase
LLAFVALAHSAAWHRAGSGGDPAPFRVGRWAAGLTLAVIVGGAVMRQGRFTAWVTSPDQGLFIPSVGEGVVWWVNFAHRGGAVLAASAVLLFAYRLARHGYPLLRWGTLVALVGIQVLLGVLSLRLYDNPHVRTVHLVVGAALFSSLCAAVALAHRRARTDAA